MCGFLCGRKFSGPLGKWQGAQLLGPRVGVCLVLEEDAKRPSEMAAPFPFPPAVTEREFPRPHQRSVWSVFWVSAVLVGVQWCLAVVLICISPLMGAAFYELVCHLCVLCGVCSGL